jgi:hypothetical protein
MTAVMLAAGPVHAFDWSDLELLRASEEELAQQRGGWIERGGVELTFGLEQFTLIDGEVLHHRSADGGLDAISGGILLRSDASGMMLQEFAASGLSSILQNSLDNISIGQVTVLNIGLAGAGTLADMPMLRLIEAGLLDRLPSF